MKTTTKKPRRKAKPAYRFDDEAADRAVGFFMQLQHVKGEKGGHPIQLEPWQIKIVRDLFGWKRADGTRKHRTAYIEVPRKNGKSTLCAGLALYMLFADGEQGAEVYSVASTREQAGMVYEPAREMVLRNPILKQNAKVRDGVKRIVYDRTASFYRPIAADDESAHGFNTHGAVVDELHTQPKRDLWDVIITSTGSRRQPLIVAITTAGFNRDSICWEQHEYARKCIADPNFDTSYYAVIYAADEADDWTDEKTWEKANPNLDVSISRDYLRTECEKAKQNPAYENTFRRLHLNQWTEQDVRTIPMEAWRSCADRTITAESLAGRDCYAGLDLSSTRDVTAWVLVFQIDGNFVCLPKFWLPEGSGSARDEQDKRAALNFARSGHITLTPGNEVDYLRVLKEVQQDMERFNVMGIGFDPWNARTLMQLAVEGGFPEDRRHLMPQSYATYNEPFKKLLGGLASRAFLHPGHPVLDWMASNVTHKEDPSGNIRPDKGKSGDKIDGICALLMGMALWIQNGADKLPTLEGDGSIEFVEW